MGDVKNIVRSGFYSYFCFGSFPVAVLEHLDKSHLKEEGFISAHSSTVQFILSEKGQKQQKVGGGSGSCHIRSQDREQ